MVASSRRLLFALVCALPLGAAPTAVQAAQTGKKSQGAGSQGKDPKVLGTKIAIVTDGPAEIYEQTTAQLAKEIRVLLAGRYADWEVPDKPNFVGNYSGKGAWTQLHRALKDPEVGLVIGMGMDVARAVGYTKTLSKPVLLPFAAPRLQKLPHAGKTSGKHNLGYLSGIVDIRRELAAFVDIAKAKDVAMLLDAHYFVRSKSMQKNLQALAGDTARLRPIAAGKTLEETLARIPADTKAVYIGPLLRMPSSEYQALVNALNNRNIATYASGGRPWVEMGALMTIVPDDDQQRRLRKIALYVEAAVSGENPATFSTDYASRQSLLLNVGTAQKIGIHPTYAQLSDAEVVGESGPAAVGPKLELKEAVARALQSNLELDAVRMDADIARGETREATAALYPTAQLQAGITQTLPESRAMLNFARTASWGGSVNIPLYTQMAWANRDSKITAQKATDRGIHAKALDIVAQTATAYINVLRAKNAEAINRQNLARIRRNLEMAKVRVELGAAGRQEVFRWEIEISDGKANVIRSEAVCSQSDIQLNRLINRPLETPVGLGAPGEDHLGLVVDPRVQPFVRDPFSFRIFREFMVKEAIANAPEIQQIDASLDSVQKLRKGQKRELWVPNLVASVSVNHNFYMDGAPRAFASMMPQPQPGAPPAPEIEFPNLPIFTVGANLVWNAFDFRRNARIQQTDSRIVKMQRQRASVAQSIEQRVRSSMHQAGASGAVVELRSQAAKSARENFELVTDAYVKGTVGIITLVDAQNQALQTELAAANALYDWLIDFVEVQRASGVFTFLESERDHSNYVARLQDFFAAHRGKSTTR